MKLSLEQLSTLAAAIGLTVLFGMESILPAAGGRRHRWQHAARNLALGGFSSIAVKMLVGGVLTSVMFWAESTGVGLLRIISLPPAVAMVAAILLFDAWMYLWHRANHQFSFLWRFHRVHHSDPEMDASTAIRFHAGEFLLSTLLRLAVIPLLGISVSQLLVYETLLLPVILFHHSNVRFPEPMDRCVRLLIVTPAIHRVHHSRLRLETDSNYSSIFSFWDRLAGTFRLRQSARPVNFGLDEYDGTWQRFSNLLLMPFTTSQNRTSILKGFSKLISRWV
jgi:sterol desaturase/sphingolipid hydroxylase (fatty acid hydroxylase superfamily)